MFVGMFLDNLCVFIGIIVIWLVRGCSYNIDHEVHKIHKGAFPHWREALVGLITILLGYGFFRLLGHLF
jgi:hypothetical protein